MRLDKLAPEMLYKFGSILKAYNRVMERNRFSAKRVCWVQCRTDSSSTTLLEHTTNSDSNPLIAVQISSVDSDSKWPLQICSFSRRWICKRVLKRQLRSRIAGWYNGPCARSRSMSRTIWRITLSCWRGLIIERNAKQGSSILFTGRAFIRDKLGG